MPGHIHLVKWTQQGIASVKQAPERFKQIKAAAKELGIESVGVWVTMGEYDVVGIWDAPDDQTMAAFTLQQATRGGARTQTLRALSEEEFAQVVSKLP